MPCVHGMPFRLVGWLRRSYFGVSTLTLTRMAGAKLSWTAGGAHALLDGELDEWRFWHGERTRQELVGLKDRNLVPGLLSSFGDPQDPALAARLLALYSFDQAPPLAQADPCTLAAADACPLTAMLPVFPTGPPAPPSKPHARPRTRRGAAPVRQGGRQAEAWMEGLG